MVENYIVTNITGKNLAKFDTRTGEIDNTVMNIHGKPCINSAWTFIQEGVIMLTGGLTTVTLSSVYIIDLATSNVTPGSDMATPRRSHAICAYRGKVFVFGGLNEQANMLDSSEMGEEVWSNNGNMTAPRRCLGAAALNGKIYLAGFGSSDMDEFDPNTASFRSLGVSIPNNNSSLVTLNN